jgi:hypothetical protein
MGISTCLVPACPGWVNWLIKLIDRGGFLQSEIRIPQSAIERLVSGTNDLNDKN